MEELESNADRESNARVSPVIQVISAIEVGNVNIIGVVPVVGPVRGVRIDHAEPVTAILEPGISPDNQEGETSNSKSVLLSKVRTEATVRDSISYVSATLLPATVLYGPVSDLPLVPRILDRFALLR